MSLDTLYQTAISSDTISVSIVEDLFKRGVNPATQNTSGNTIFRIAAKNQWDSSSVLRIIAAAVAGGKLTTNALDQFYSDYLTYCNNISPEVVKAMFEAGANPLTSNASSATIFRIAAENQWASSSFINYLHAALATKKLSTSGFNQIYNDYITYCNTISLEVVTTLFQAGADPLTRNRTGNTLFNIATKNQWDSSTILTLLKGAIATKKLTKRALDEIFSDYISNINKINLHVVKALFGAGAHPFTANKSNKTLFHIAAENQWDCVSFLSYLNEAIATKKLTETMLNQIFTVYITHQNTISTQVVKAMFEAGTNPLTSSNSGKTIFRIAAENNWSSNTFIDYINAARATKKVTTKGFNQIYFDYISYSKTINLEVVQALLQAGANPNTRNLTGNTIAQIAINQKWDSEHSVKLFTICANAEEAIRESSPGIPVIKNPPAYTDEPVLYGAQLLETLSSTELTPNEIARHARVKSSAKEDVIAYIASLSPDKQVPILANVFTEKTNLHEFFAVQRGWLPTRYSRGTFKILKRMQEELLQKMTPDLSSSATTDYTPTLFGLTPKPVTNTDFSKLPVSIQQQIGTPSAPLADM